MDETIAHQWRPIEPLPAGETLTDGELVALLEVCRDVREDLRARGLEAAALERLHRSWSIETGIIEGVYSIDRGVTETLLERGIDAAWITHDQTGKSPELVAAIIQAHRDTLEGLFAFVRAERALSTSYIKELHASLLRHQETMEAVDSDRRVVTVPLEKGAFKRNPNSPLRPDGRVHEYCPPLQVDSEMDRLIELHLRYTAEGVPAEVHAAWLHHRFTQIHPFADGNGRVARILATLVFVKAGWFPLEIAREGKTEYIDALEVADADTFRPLVDLFVRRQREALIEMLRASDAVAPALSVEEAIERAADAYSHSMAVAPESRDRVDLLARDLRGVADTRMSETASLLRSKFSTLDPRFEVARAPTPPPELRAACQRAVPHETGGRDQWAGVRFGREREHSIRIWFHAIARQFHGLMGAAMFYSHGVTAERIGEIFQFNYRETNSIDRFRPWLETTLTQALNRWRGGM